MALRAPAASRIGIDARNYGKASSACEQPDGDDQNPEGTYESWRNTAVIHQGGAREASSIVDRRDDGNRRTIQILSRRTKNNPVLIGETRVWQKPRSWRVGPTHRQTVMSPRPAETRQLISAQTWAP